MSEQRATTAQEPPSALRQDARRNRERLLAAAGELLARDGTEVSIADIATRAGVGKGTVFRHYASKDALVAEVVCEVLETLLAQGQELAATLPPADALREFMTAAIHRQADDRAFCEVVAGASADNERVQGSIRRLYALVDGLTARARDAGAIRVDVTGDDIALLLSGIYQTAAPLARTDPDLWRRYLALTLDGLLPRHANPLPHPSPHLASGGGD
ncbi:TetR/AcrR family transcriptional regulator [Herbiconiux ginsengi]|uniref:Transcriptional regulator, TetR family n=1 Tax=Herbiconiux ginsengi TaxID=381665 RepID=A0A1H3PIA3_9MICO|nr:TetR/AcrR family transcriptional regulator [Herbiconiux ginsengi]SDZ00728.1 transcriptional regulator, TetR family [Herbiconiux ginsengi]